MRDVTARNFGLAIAYLIPGFVALGGVATVSEHVRAWLGGSEVGGPTVGGFLYVTLGSVAAGMMVSAIRWVVVDSIHHLTGLKRPMWNDSRLNRRLRAVEYLVETHYRYYQFYANMFIAAMFAYLAWSWSGSSLSRPTTLWLVTVLVAEFVLLAASRDALRKYYNRMSLLLGLDEREKDDDQWRTSNGRRNGEKDLEG